MSVHLHSVHSHYTLCKWAKQVVLDMGHQVVSDIYFKYCSPRAKAELDVCKECKKEIEK